MSSYDAFDRGVEVKGQMVRAVVEEAMGRFSDEYREQALAALEEEDIGNPDPDSWYPQQAWLDAFETIASDLQLHVLARLGEQIPDVALWPDKPQSVPEGLRSIDEAYRRNHRGGDIGYYRFERTDDQRGQVTCYNPYPCPFDRGLVRGVAREYAPVDGFVFVEETGEACRRDGADACTYRVYW